MGLKRLKGYTERFLEPLSKYLASRGVEPNHLTVAGLLASAFSGALYHFGEQPLAGVVLAVSGLCDLLDGNLARTQGKQTPFGAFLDSTVDRYSDMFVLFGILSYGFGKGDWLLFWVTVFALIGSVMVSYTRARAECIIERCDVGLMERPERVVVLILFSLVGRVFWGVLLIAIFANITALHRIYHTYKVLKEKDVGLS